MVEEAKGSAAFLNAENIRKDRCFSVGRKGISTHRVLIHGQKIHAGYCTLGTSAVKEAAHKIIALEKDNDNDGITFNCGVIQGGTASNIVPDFCEMQVEYRFKNMEQKKQADERFQEIVATSYVEGTHAEAEKNTFFGVPKEEALLTKMAARYTYDENRFPKRLPLECVYNLSADYESGGAGLTSCTEDYALFLDALACGGIGKSGKRILSHETVALMGTNHLTGRQLGDFHQLRPGYGYGLGVRTHCNPAESGSLSPLGEFGWDGAAGAFSMVDPKNKLSLTYFQHIHGWDVKIQTEMRNALYECLGE